MAGTRLSEFSVKNASIPESGQAELWDSVLPGFGLRVSYAGTKSWVVLTRVNGKQVRFTIGRYPAISLKDARDIARQKLLDAQRGIDPRAEKRAKRDAEKYTVAFLGAEFIRRSIKPNNRTWKETERIFRKEIYPTVGHLPVTEVTKRDINDILNRIVEGGHGTMSNRVHSVLSRFFNWCHEEDYVPFPPTFGVKKKAREHERDRYLDDDELGRVWAAAEKIGWPFGPVIKLLILTGQRRQEVAGMKWAEIDLDRRLWTIPRDRAKSDRANEVPLSRMALDVLASLPSIDGLVFSTTGSTPVSGFQNAKERIDIESGVFNWKIHDLRRTVATNLARNGVSQQIVGRVLNHSAGKNQGVTAIYNRYDYEAEKREALDGWGEKVRSLADRAGELHSRDAGNGQ